MSTISDEIMAKLVDLSVSKMYENCLKKNSFKFDDINNFSDLL